MSWKLWEYMLARTSLSQSEMNVLTALNNQLVAFVPFYGSLADCAQDTFHRTMTEMSLLSEISSKKVAMAKKYSSKFHHQVLWLLRQPAADIYAAVCNQFDFPEGSPNQLRFLKIKAILAKLAEFYNCCTARCSEMMSNFEQGCEQGKLAIRQNARHYESRMFLPAYSFAKAVFEVSKEWMVQILMRQVEGLKMSYEVSKDTVTMLVTGKFDEKRFLERINEGLTNLKELTVEVVQQGLKIKISRADLLADSQAVLQKLMEIVRETKQIGKERFETTKAKTAQTYNSVLEKIRDRQALIAAEYNRKRNLIAAIQK